MLWNLITKDLLRVKKTPGVYLLKLAFPLVITLLIGFTFGTGDGDNSFPKIKVGWVDEDEDFLSQFLAGAFEQEEMQKHVKLQKLTWEEAKQAIENQELSAIIRIPPNFSKHFLKAQKSLPIEVLKNPSESFFPRIIEEGVLIAVEFLNALSRNLKEELPEIVEITSQKYFPSTQKIAELAEKIAKKFKSAEKYLFPPIITLKTPSDAKEDASKEEKKKAPSINIFTLILPGLSALFLLFIAEQAMSDLLKERQMKTLARYQTLQSSLFSLVFAKILFGVCLLIISGIILIGGGGLIFRIQWQSPFELLLILVSYSFIGTGLVSLLISLVQNERQMGALNSIVIMGGGFLGGSMIPVSELPAVIRDHISIYLPNYWFIESIVQLQQGTLSTHDLALVSTAFLFGGLLLSLLSSVFLQKRLRAGGHP
ncbi:MAG: ABC transporter permease [Planctomycetota bacterium]